MDKISRADALRGIITLPALAAAMAAGTALADAMPSNKKQFRYQDRPGAKGQKCSGCRFFRAPHGCTIVHGKISPDGWCIAWVKR